MEPRKISFNTYLIPYRDSVTRFSISGRFPSNWPDNQSENLLILFLIFHGDNRDFTKTDLDAVTSRESQILLMRF